MFRRIVLSPLPLLLLAEMNALAASPAPDHPPSEPVALFALDRVELLAGPFRHAQELNLAYLLAHEVDRLVAPFRREAGLPPKAEPYPNWESMGLDGHSAGHYLTALAQHAVVSDSAECRERLAYMVAELAICQEANGDGYLGGVPNGAQLWSALAAGEIDVHNFGLNGAWVPWYNLHKTFAGLRDAYLLAGNVQARDLLVRFSDWCLGVTAGLSDAQMQAMLQSEHGGMNEVLADVAAITGEARFLEAARRFSHRAILAPLLLREDRLTGLHANTQIPKVIGFAQLAALTGETDWAEASEYFWETVVRHRTVAIGGNSVREHFHPREDASALIHSREGPESCNTYNMLRLTERLFQRAPTAALADYYEQALFNHILSTQHPEHGGYVYFTPLRPRHYRVYSQPGTCFWCCVGSGMENHGKYGQFIYAREAGTLFVNLFIPSLLNWSEAGIRLRQETGFPLTPGTTLTVSADTPRRFTLALRHPGWARGEGFAVKVNGRDLAPASLPGEYLRLDREWRDGDRVELNFPMPLALEPLPGSGDHVAVRCGPIVLAARIAEGDLSGLIADDSRMGHVAPGAYLPLDAAPMLVGTEGDILAALEPVPGRPLHFRAPASIRPDTFDDLVLEPFHGLHDSRYQLYWRRVAPEDYDRVLAALAESEATALALEGRILDAVVPGEQQPEVEHAFAAKGPLQGSQLGRTWRAAEDWFSYRLDPRGGTPEALLLTFWAAEAGRHFDVLVNGRRVATLRLDGGDPDRFADREIPLPEALRQPGADGRLEVRFEGREGSIAGALYGLRLLGPPAKTR
jgi:uncharacterized protein